MQHILRSKKGFTLVELLVVIAIIGLLAGVVVVAVGPARAKARDSRRIADAQAVQTAIELYRDSQATNGAPATGIAALETALTTGGFLARMPTEPGSNAAYAYINTGGTAQTYVFQVQTEGVTSIGPAGYICVSGAGMAPKTTACAAADEK